MAGKRISELPRADSVGQDALIEIAQAGQSLSASLAQCLTSVSLPRVKFLGNAIFYVRPLDGVDNPPGLGTINAPGLAYRTADGALAAIQKSVDFGGVFSGTLQLVDGAYTDAIAVCEPFVGHNTRTPFTIVGNTAHPENVTVSVTGNAFLLENVRIALAGMKISTTPGSGGSIVSAQFHAIVTHSNLWFAGCDHEMIESHTNSLVIAAGPTRVSGSCESFCHFTENGQILFENFPLALVEDDGVSPGTTSTGPKCINYVFGGNGNGSRCSLARTAVTGSFGVDGTHTSWIFIHIGAQLNLSSCTGIEGLFPGNKAPVVQGGGQIIYDPGAADTYFCRQTAAGDNADGFANNDTRAYLTTNAAITALSKRNPDQIFVAIPTVQLVANGSTPWGAVHLFDIPGVAEAILLGDETTPVPIHTTAGANCIEAQNTQTKWHIIGFEFTSDNGGGINGFPGSADLAFQSCKFGACTGPHINLSNDSYIEDTGPWTISGNAASLMSAGGGSSCRLTQTVTKVGTPNYTDRGVRATEGAILHITSDLSGITGTRCHIDYGAGVNHNNTSSQVGLPGDVDGTVDAGTFGWLS